MSIVSRPATKEFRDNFPFEDRFEKALAKEKRTCEARRMVCPCGAMFFRDGNSLCPACDVALLSRQVAHKAMLHGY